MIQTTGHSRLQEISRHRACTVPIWWQLPETETLKLPPRFLKHSQEFFDGLGIRDVSKQLILATLIHESYYNSALTANLLGEEAVHGTAGFRSVRTKLEFLGDAVLNSVLTTYLVETSGNGPIGNISKAVHHLRSNQAMGVVGLGPLKLADRILCDPDLKSQKPTTKKPHWHAPAVENLMSDTVETIIGGVFVERGIGVASTLVLDKLLPLLQQHARSTTGDPVSLLQELIVAHANCFPEYRIERLPILRSRVFKAEVYLGKQLLGTGRGDNHKKAKREAAQQGLDFMTSLKS
ncbi:hypothetical protein KFL_000790430 [Klebsormidium nitens]|uniref:Uncharacterized protein n=1 Tax=Klebsormidium nitens TaxID=105231 RepID=A0A1Y1HZY3_KLENI|nr:hypothetical protein KFL_000790430 [Klebsormidium nitens]|eukprot:GAQ81418.1 hypothetical protein KFL_000790430 [Klebsormidium nitens]